MPTMKDSNILKNRVQTKTQPKTAFLVSKTRWCSQGHITLHSSAFN